jgi:hypothetical protein
MRDLIGKIPTKDSHVITRVYLHRTGHDADDDWRRSWCASSIPVSASFSKRQRVLCDWRSGGKPWFFLGDAYTRAYLFGGPVGGDNNIVVAYGICTKF